MSLTRGTRKMSSNAIAQYISHSMAQRVEIELRIRIKR